MRSKLQILASHANGAKSQGPVTPEGKLASAGNRLDHGLLAEALAIEGEDAERFAALTEICHRLVESRDDIELKHVENMIMCRWRQMRVWLMESAAALCRLTDESHSMALMNRYDARFYRQFNRAHLLDLRAILLPQAE